MESELNHDIDELVDLKTDITHRIKSQDSHEYQIILGYSINGENKMNKARREQSLPGFCIGDDYAKETEKAMLISGL